MLLVLHNDGAENFELVVTGVPDGGTSPGGPGEATVVVPHDPETRLEGSTPSPRTSSSPTGATRSRGSG